MTNVTVRAILQQRNLWEAERDVSENPRYETNLSVDIRLKPSNLQNLLVYAYCSQMANPGQRQIQESPICKCVHTELFAGHLLSDAGACTCRTCDQYGIGRNNLQMRVDRPSCLPKCQSNPQYDDRVFFYQVMECCRVLFHWLFAITLAP